MEAHFEDVANKGYQGVVMNDVSVSEAISETIVIVNYYGFELPESDTAQVVKKWSEQYAYQWLRPAVLEALYRGRYKGISVEEILRAWHRRGKPKLNFNSEFERLICEKLSLKVPFRRRSLHSLTSSRIQKPPSIQQFQPIVQSSDIYHKLKAIALSPAPGQLDV